MTDDASETAQTSDGIAMRLLPWTTEEGKPCYLKSAGENGVISRMADIMEAEQIRTAREVLAQARGLMQERDLGKQEYRFVASRLAEGLADTLRIAESRASRLGTEDPRLDDGAEELEEAP